MVLEGFLSDEFFQIWPHWTRIANSSRNYHAIAHANILFELHNSVVAPTAPLNKVGKGLYSIAPNGPDRQFGQQEHAEFRLHIAVWCPIVRIVV